MSKNHPQVANELYQGLAALREGLPSSMEAFSKLGSTTYEAGVLDSKTKELMALAIGITVRCDGCIAFHTKAARDRGANREEVLETIAVAIHMGGGPSMVYGVEALQAFDQFEQE